MRFSPRLSLPDLICMTSLFWGLQAEGATLSLKGGSALSALQIPRPVKLALAVGGIFLSFSYFALLQEDLFKNSYAGERFKSTFFMMVAERGVNALVAWVFLLVTQTSITR